MPRGFLVVMVMVAACKMTSSGNPGSSTDLGGGGSPGFILSNPSNNPGGVEIHFEPSGSTYSTPPMGDPWLSAPTPMSFSLAETEGSKTTHASFALAEDGTTLTITLHADANSAAMYQNASAAASAIDFTICYRAPGAKSIDFMYNCSGTPTAGGSGVGSAYISYGATDFCRTSAGAGSVLAWRPMQSFTNTGQTDSTVRPATAPMKSVSLLQAAT